MPYAYVRGIYWCLFKNNLFDEGHESLDACMGISISLVQAEKNYQKDGAGAL